MSAGRLRCAGRRLNPPARKMQVKLSALGSRLSALGSRLSALGSRLSALGSRLSALGSRLSALGSRLSALGSRLSALGSRLSALGSRLSASCRSTETHPVQAHSTPERIQVHLFRGSSGRHRQKTMSGVLLACSNRRTAPPRESSPMPHPRGARQCSRLHAEVPKLTRSRRIARQKEFRCIFFGEALAGTDRKQCPVSC